MQCNANAPECWKEGDDEIHIIWFDRMGPDGDYARKFKLPSKGSEQVKVSIHSVIVVPEDIVLATRGRNRYELDKTSVEMITGKVWQ